jgi:hypothetical protein
VCSSSVCPPPTPRRKRAVDIELAEKEAAEKSIAAQAEKVRAAVEAEARKLLNEAENVLTDEARYSLFRRNLLERIEGIVSASVKPMEKIQDIRIMQLDGMNGGRNGKSERQNPTDEVIDSALRYRVQAPMVDSLMADLGIDGSKISQMGGLMREARDIQSIADSQARSRRDSDDSRSEDSGAGGGEPPAEGGGGSSGGGRRRSTSRTTK